MSEFGGRSNASGSSRSSSASVAKVFEQQRRAELEIRARRLKEKQAIAKAQLELAHTEEAFDIETEISISDAKLKLFISEEDIYADLARDRPKPSESCEAIHNTIHEWMERSPCDDLGLDVKVEMVSHEEAVDVGINYDPVGNCVNNRVTLNPQAGECLPAERTYEHMGERPQVQTLHVVAPATVVPVKLDSFAQRPINDSSSGMFGDLIKQMKKPVISIKSFSGNPLEFSRFVRQFENCIVELTDTASERMTYLEQYTSGEAHRIVVGYSYLDPEVGFESAMSALRSRYGDVELVAHAFVKRALDWPLIKFEQPKALDDYAVFLVECQNAVCYIEATKTLEYAENMKRLVAKLPFGLQEKWRSVVQDKRDRFNCVKFNDFVTFVRREAKKVMDPVYGRQSIEDVKGRSYVDRKGDHPQRGGVSFSTTLSEQNMQSSSKAANERMDVFSKPCLYCQGDHAMDVCEFWKTVPFSDRTPFIKGKGLCFKCLRYGHPRSSCMSNVICEICGKPHLTMMHIHYNLDFNVRNEHVNVVLDQDSLGNSQGTEETGLICGRMGAGSTECTMPIIPVRVWHPTSGIPLQTYAFLDIGSSVSFCSAKLMNKLGLKGEKRSINIQSMNSNTRVDTELIDGLRVGDLDGQNEIKLPTCYTAAEIPVTQKHIPSSIDIASWSHLGDVVVPKIDADIDLLLGGNVPDAFAPIEIRTGPSNTPHAIRTRLGWSVWNLMRSNRSAVAHVNRIEVAYDLDVIQQHDEQLQEFVKRMINMDFPERSCDDRKENSQQDNRFLEEVGKSIRFEDNHYHINLPLKDRSSVIPDNKEMALSRLERLRRKLKGDSKFCEDYRAFMAKLFQKNYAEIVPDDQLHNNNSWYIPHHAVYHPTKQKIRVVFDCAAKYGGTSLNQALLQGPDLTNNLVGVLIRFRQDRIAIVSDIESMFYRVRVAKEDCDMLRFYWWADGNFDGQPVVCRMLVHLFGAASSPSCCNYALRQTVLDNADTYGKELCNTVLNNFYVDDCLKSVDSDEKAIELVKGLTSLCARGGFRLTKWFSNSATVLDSVPETERAIPDDRQFDQEHTEKALGVTWFTQNDTFAVKIPEFSDKPTKRNVLSTICSVYDPLGLVAPFVLPARVLLQELCKMPWDEEVTGSDLRRWHSWLSTLVCLQKVQLERCYKPKGFGRIISRQLHCFCDASELGYGVVIYLRLVDESGAICCSFVMGKSRVTPLKKVTIPRLELQAATTAVRLSTFAKGELEFDLKESDVYYWTDSMIVLGYIKNERKRFRTFVANRISVIREATSSQQWRHVGTKVNPADDASRGLTIEEYLKDPRWVKGPRFLWHSDDQWPVLSDIPPCSDIDCEVQAVVNVLVEDHVSSGLDTLIAHFSDWNKLKRIAGWFLFARLNLKRLSDARKTYTTLGNSGGKCRATVGVRTVAARSLELKSLVLPVNIIEQAEMSLVSFVQQQHFHEEFITLASKADDPNRTLKRSSPLYRLNAFVENDVIRVGGRLDRAQISFNSKHPMILPKCCRLAQLIVKFEHHRLGHYGKNAVLYSVRQKYWIFGANALIRKCVSQCVICRKYRRKPLEQRMADLPEDRVRSGEPPFTRTGMDYFGPFEVKHGRSSLKRYGVIFTCLTTRAVHIEVAHTLETDSCINAIRRFMARRGNVKVMISDNGTNLVGANRELREEIQKWNVSKICTSLSKQHVEWKFNPPSGSHFGGVWERLIRSIRKIMNGLLSGTNVRLNDECLSTIFCEVEAILNGRPITRMSDNPDDLECLTPNHLLMLHAGSQPVCDSLDQKDCYKRRWRHCQVVANMFWKRWASEYLADLQKRSKWCELKQNLKKDDLVLILDDMPRNSWGLGRVVECIQDKHGLVRMVDVRIRSGVLRRPIDKLCLLLEHELV